MIGNLYDNAKTLFSPHDLIRELAFWIDGTHNRERRHATMAYLSPIDYEQHLIDRRKLDSAML